MKKVAHIINPFSCDANSFSAKYQQLTIKSIENAYHFTNEKSRIELMAVCYQDEKISLPSIFKLAPSLTKSVQDEEGFSSKKRMPILKDIFQFLSQNSDADYFIFSNIEIS